MRGFPSAERLENERADYGAPRGLVELIREHPDGGYLIDFDANIAGQIIRAFDTGEDDPLMWSQYRDLGYLKITVERLDK